MTRKADSERQLSLPGALERRLAMKTSLAGPQRIPHLKILQALQDPALGIGDIAEIYRLRVLTVKTRSIRLLGRKTPASILETLLGYEVKSAYKRIQCPDLVTARYLKLFTELGCRTIRLPYDPTLTADLIRELEEGMARINGGVRELFPKDHQLQLYVLRRIYEHLRARLRKPLQDPLPVESSAETECD